MIEILIRVAATDVDGVLRRAIEPMTRLRNVDLPQPGLADHRHHLAARMRKSSRSIATTCHRWRSAGSSLRSR
jgi:hypothetical protein